MRLRQLFPLFAALALIVTATTLTATTASAEGHEFKIGFTDGKGAYPLTEPRVGATPAGPAIPEGGTVTVECEFEGPTVENSPYPSTKIWTRLQGGSYMPQAFISTNSWSWTPGVPRCEGTVQDKPAPERPKKPQQKYNRQKAVKWALDNVNATPRFDEDCTWYVSQALWAGDLPKSDHWKSDNKAFSFNPPKASVNANEFKEYLVNKARYATIRELSWSQNDVPEAEVGDVILYDLFGPGTEGAADGFIDHAAVITGFSGKYPLVSGHTNAVRNQGWTYSSANNKFIEQVYSRPRVYLLHITY